MSVSINIENVTKRYGNHTVIPNLSLNIKNGEFFTLLGPSGCGKTTILRMISGFNSIEAGIIKFDDKIINDIPAYKRNIGMVFQNYAIFPHMTVRENIEYGLKLRKESKQDIKNKVDKILNIVKIEEYQNKLPEILSGGQQQRVALARAIVISPSVLIMDEPLSNLDAKLRIEMRNVIKDIQKQIGITTVYVTHDQEEALAISDRIAIIKDGNIQQIASPINIYSKPYNVFVSTFIGHSNLFKSVIQINNNKVSLIFKSGFKIDMTDLIDINGIKNNDEVITAIRPEEFILDDKDGINAQIVSKTFLGKYTTYFLKCDDSINDELIEYSNDSFTFNDSLNINNNIKIVPNKNRINVFTKDMERSLIIGVKKEE